MSYSFIPYGRQTILDSDISSVVDVLRSPFLTQGPCVPQFENAIKSVVGSKHALAVNSATSALHLACQSLGLQDGDTLWTSPITFVSSANCARFCGADIDFVDIDLDTGLMCPNLLESKIALAAKTNTLPKVIVPVHLAGTSCAMKDIESIVKPYGIKIIEDASHAIGSRYLDSPVGSCKYSDLTVFSFHPVKIITTAEGGAIATNNTDLANKIATLRTHGITKDPDTFIFESPGPWYYEQHDLGYNYRLTDVQAALGLSQLSRLSEIVEERNALHNRYIQLFQELPVHFLSTPTDCYSSFHLAIVRLNNCSPEKHRYIFEGLRQAGIGVQLHYIPVHLQPYYRNLGFKLRDFPRSEEYAQSSLSLPLFPGLSYSEQDYIFNIFRQLLN